jgi:zinc transport system permease protein
MNGLTTELFFESWELFRDPTLAGTLLGAMLGMLGVYIVAHRMVFLSAALSQTAGLGVTLAFYAQVHLGLTGFLVDPLTGASVLAFVTVALVMADRSHLGHRRDALLGIAFLVGSAGMLIVGTRIVQEIQDIQTLIFGSAVAVLPADFKLVIWVVLALGVVHLLWWRGFASVVFDRQDAAVRGLPAWPLEFLLLASLAVAISVCTRVLGALPAFAFSVLPALAALRLAPNIPRAILLATLFGGFCGFAGYLVAFLYSFPVGASQAVIGVVLVVAAEVVNQLIKLPSRLTKTASKQV